MRRPLIKRVPRRREDQLLEHRCRHSGDQRYAALGMARDGGLGKASIAFDFLY
jgi:hypothetical protein